MSSNVPDITNELSSLGDNDVLYVAQSDEHGGYINAKIKGDKINGGSETITARKELGRVTLASAQTTITFDSIDQTYDSLVLKVKAKSDAATTGTNLSVDFNSDSNDANYDTQRLYASNGTVSSPEGSGIVQHVPGASSPSNAWGRGTYVIDGYTDTGSRKTIISNNSSLNDTGNILQGQYSTDWNNTAAITRMDFTLASGDFDTGTEFILYGEKEVTVGSGGGGGTETILARKVLGTETLTSDSPSIDFSGLDQTYDRLIIQGYVRSDQAGTADNFLVEFNGDTTPSNYHRQSNYGVNGAAGVSEVSDAGLGVVSGNTAPAGSFGQITIVIENYAGSKRKVALSDFVLEAATNDLYAGQRGMIWESVSAITQVTFKPGSGTNLKQDTHLKIIGEKEVTVGSGVTENSGFTEIKTSRDFEESAGSWRPIYKKSVDVGALPNAVLKTVAHNISNLSKVVKITGSADDGTNQITIPRANPDTFTIDCYITSANINIDSNANVSSFSGIVAIEYTKTTDTPTASPRFTTL
jgi:hypothetical protein